LFGEIRRFEGTPLTTPAQFQTVFGYREAPQLAIDASQLRHTKLLYTSVERARDDKADYILYIDPHWPAADACVTISGYDVPALPQSGVMQAAIYWSLIAEASAGGPMATSATPRE
jgi:hypothetical protein